MPIYKYVFDCGFETYAWWEVKLLSGRFGKPIRVNINEKREE